MFAGNDQVVLSRLEGNVWSLLTQLALLLTEAPAGQPARH